MYKLFKCFFNKNFFTKAPTIRFRTQVLPKKIPKEDSFVLEDFYPKAPIS